MTPQFSALDIHSFSTPQPVAQTVPPPHTTHDIDKHARTPRASCAHRDTGSVRAEVTVAEVAKPGHYVLALVEDLRVGVRRVRVGSEN